MVHSELLNGNTVGLCNVELSEMHGIKKEPSTLIGFTLRGPPKAHGKKIIVRCTERRGRMGMYLVINIRIPMFIRKTEFGSRSFHSERKTIGLL